MGPQGSSIIGFRAFGLASGSGFRIFGVSVSATIQRHVQLAAYPYMMILSFLCKSI